MVDRPRTSRLKSEAGSVDAVVVWIAWFEIAVAHLHAAEKARTRAAEAGTSGEAAKANHEETQAAMVVIAAAAFCIDALHVKLDGMLIPRDRSDAEKRVDRIVETLKLSLDLAERAHRFETSIKELFDLNNALVHFRSAEEDALQPLSTQTRDRKSYTLDKAGWAVDLAYGVLFVALMNPRPERKALVPRVADRQHMPQYLDRMRRGDAW